MTFGQIAVINQHSQSLHLVSPLFVRHKANTVVFWWKYLCVRICTCSCCSCDEIVPRAHNIIILAHNRQEFACAFGAWTGFLSLQARSEVFLFPSKLWGCVI